MITIQMLCLPRPGFCHGLMPRLRDGQAGVADAVWNQGTCTLSRISVMISSVVMLLASAS